MAPVVALVDVLDHLFAPTGLDVDVDVRGAVTRRGQESLEEQVQLHRVGVRDTQRETDRRVRGRTAALTVDVVATTELGDVPDREEVTGEAEGLDDTEFVIDLVPRAHNALALARAVTLRRALFHDHFQVGLLVHPRGRREGRQVRRDQAKVEGQRGGEFTGLVDDPGPAREASALLGVAAQVRQRARVEPPLHLLQALAGTQGREHVGAREGVGRGVVHVVRRHE